MVKLIKDFLAFGFGDKLVIIVIVMVIALYMAISYKFKWPVILLLVALLQGFILAFLVLFMTYSPELHTFLFVPGFLLSFFVFALLPAKKAKPQLKVYSPWKFEIPTVGSEYITIENLKRGIAIFGSAGAGKTESVFVPIIQNGARCNVPGINYDYKDGEISEIVKHFYGESDIKIYDVLPHKPEYSYRINPIKPEYLDTPEYVSELVSVLFEKGKLNKSKGNEFFQEVPQATLAGIIWRLRCDLPEYCTLPHAIGIALTKNPRELAAFLEKNMQSRVLAAPFYDSISATEQLAGVKASLSNELRKFAFANVFYVLSGDEVQLDVNNPSNPAMLNLVTTPDKEATLSPFISLIFRATIKSMQKRDMLPSYLLMDEAATLSLPNFSRIPATMRSYNIATVFSLQDKVLGTEQLGDISTRAILSNLSYQIIGKSNDSESIEYFKKYIAEIEKKQVSKSYGAGLLPKGETRKTESFRESTKYKSQDFRNLETGEFFVLADGKDRITKIKLIPFERVSFKVRNHLTELDLQDNFDKILLEAKNLE